MSNRKLVIFDEAYRALDNRNDALREELRAIDGVPNAEYLVEGDKVFVFGKLATLVSNELEVGSSATIADLAHRFLPECYVSPSSAVHNWQIKPEPYQVVKTESQELTIRHAAFNATLPGVFQEKSDADEVFVRLLSGQIQPGVGEFSYRGQPMTLCDPVSPSQLPAKPTFNLEPANAIECYLHLGQRPFLPGFEPVSQGLFYEVKELERAWEQDAQHAVAKAWQQAKELWAMVGQLPLDTLNDPEHGVMEEWEEDLPELRSLHPELAKLSDGALFEYFDDYQRECCYISGWSASREDGFLFYLLGKLAKRNIEGSDAANMGQWVAHALLNGEVLEDALAFGVSADMYDRGIGRLASRIADAMRFLETDSKAQALRGQKITTFQDTFRLGRKYNGSLITAVQDVKAFSAGSAGP